MRIIAIALASLAVFVIVTVLRSITSVLPPTPPFHPPECRRGKRKKDGKPTVWR